MTVRQDSATPDGRAGPNIDDFDPRRQWGECLQPPVAAGLPDDDTTPKATQSESSRDDTEPARGLGHHTDPCWFVG